MTRAEFTDETFDLPRVGAPRMDNCIATILRHGNRSSRLNLDRIAYHQGFNAVEFDARFAHLQTAYERQMSEASLHPNNICEIPEGK